MRARTAIIVVMAVIAIDIFLFGCNPEASVNGNTGKVWFVDSDGVVQTNDLERLQRETPFEIVLPVYLPVELSDSPLTFTKEVGVYTDTDVRIQFTYTNYPTAKMITIDETNYQHGWTPNYENNPVYFEIDGTEVLRETNNGYVRDGEIYVLVDVYFYTWYRNSVSYVVHIRGYSETESRKIMESMIQ